LPCEPMRGKQEPDYRFCAPYSRTEGPFAADLSSSYALDPHPWQRSVLNDWLAFRSDGKLLNQLALLPVPRQNGKTGDADPRCTWGLVKRGEWILYTAQEYQTAKKAFDRLRDKFGTRRDDPFARHPELNALVSCYTTSANMMVLDLVNGAHIEFRTRGSNSGVGRGGTFDVLVVDEAQDYTDAQDAALSPLVSAAPHGSPQTIMMGTVPGPENRLKGALFRRTRDRLHEAPTPGECISEWGAAEVGDVNDRSRWYAHNPSLGYQLLEDALAADAKKMLPEVFAREHLGWWPPKTALVVPAVDEEAWKACSVADAPAGEADAFGVKFSADGESVAVSSAVLLGDGSVYVELAALRPSRDGVKWLLNAMMSRPSAVWAVDGKSGAHALVQRAERLGDAAPATVSEVSTADAIAAAATFVDAVRERRLCWCEAVGDVLSESVLTSPRRAIGSQGGWGFGGEQPAPVESAALAAWAALNIDEGEDMEVFVG
jgi:hypothetical protein